LSQLHGGTVTFLFTDIEGSTRLLQQLREGFAEVLAAHHRVLREAFAEHGGEELGTEGDAFFVAFRRARDAVAGAAAAQRGLATHPWPEGAEVRVRMGIHSGEPAVGEEGYQGMALHRAARICSAGHGGQVLLSNATRELVEDDLPNGIALRDLGEHVLKDIDRPERLFQLVIEGLRNEFPACRTAEPPVRGGRLALLRRPPVLVGLLVALAAAVAIPLLALRGGGAGVTVAPNSVAVIDPGSNRVVDSVPVGARPEAVTLGSGKLWVANVEDKSVSRIDVGTRRAEGAIPMTEAVFGLASGSGSIWAVSSSPTQSFATVRRIDPSFGSVADRVTVRSSGTGGQTGGSLAVSRGTVWAVTGAVGQLARIDARTRKLVTTIDPGVLPFGVAVGGGAVWVTDVSEDAVTRIDPVTNIVEKSIQVGRGPLAIAYGAGAVWVANGFVDTVTRIDPETNAPAATIAVGDLPAAIAVGERGVWVANAGDGTVSRIDPKRNRVVETIETGGSPAGIAVGEGRVWVTVEAREASGSAARPGIGRLEALSDPGSLDPALTGNGLAAQIEYATCAKLVNYPDREPLRVEPEVAAGLPAVSGDGKTYTLKIRRGFRFSPPSRERVTAATFKYAIERSLSPRMHGGARGRLSTVAGARLYEDGKARHVSGIAARGDELTIRLTEPDPTLLQRLALPFFCAVPTNTPIDPRGVPRIPTAGPYYVSSYVPAQVIVLERNPSYGGTRPRRLKEIRIALSVDANQSLSHVAANRADYALEGVPRGAHARLGARYGPGSAAADKGGRQQYFVNPALQVDFLVVNSRSRLFSDARMRRAVSFAVSRRELAADDAFELGRPADSYLPPAMPGFTGRRLYPFEPNLARARSLARGKGGRAVLYTCNLLPCRQLAQIVTKNLEPLGIVVDVEELSIPMLLTRLQRPNEPFDLAAYGYGSDLADPGDFLSQMLALPSLDLGPYERRLAAASRLSGSRRYRAFGRLADELAGDAAPIVAFANPVRRDFFSARMGCQAYNPLYGMDLAALCIR
jgi:YVTN family beta-propeller protein